MSDAVYMPKPMAYVGNPLDRTGNWRQKDDEIAARLADPRTRFLPVWRLQPLVTSGEIKSPAWVGRTDIAPMLPGAIIVALGMASDIAHFAIDVSDLDEADARARFESHGAFGDLWSLHSHVAIGESAILATARAMTDWHRRHGFCAVCGQPTALKQGGFMRLCTNDACKSQHFPRTDPVVIMLIGRGDKCLLGRQERFPPGWFSTLAGFIEPGETIEDAVRREVKEETAVDVGRVDFKFSQPWPFPSSLMIGCVGEALSEAITVDKHELADARWFDRSAVLAALQGREDAGLRVPPPVAVAHHLIAYWATS
jgi:NAD+ diphosphatase